LSSFPAVSSPEFYPQEREPKSRLSGNPAQWYAVFTMPRHEKRTVGHCSERRIESFLPLYQVRHRWKNRSTATVDLPLFPNYFFVRIDLQERVQVLKVPGVVSIISSGRQPLPIADEYIAALRGGLLTHRIEPHPNVEAGDRVCITTGPMAGMEGVLDRQKNELRVVLRLEMIGRSVAVEVGAQEISYVGPQPVHSTSREWRGLPKPLPVSN
jgi:transcription antitermination factor NusG